MKKITLILSLFFCFGSVVFAQNKSGDRTVFGKKVDPKNITPSGHIRCASTEYEEYLREQNPKMETRAQFENWMAQKIQEQKDIQQVASQGGGIIYIPVVVHVIHNGDAYGVNENITDEQVQSQITVMTQDFRKMAGTPGANSNPVGADTQIEFVLAKVDPNGNPTNGINRINLCQDSWSTAAINSTVKPTTSWDPTQYMNMWSVNFTDGTLLGYAQFPSSSGLSGLNASGGAANTDGVVAGYRFFGSSDLATGNFAAPFDKGRTMTHEVGHFLGLRHIWAEDGAACVGDDYCVDTPMAASPNGGCPTGTDSCAGAAGLDMIENYMDYTDDACMNIFTTDQKSRITTVMNNSPRRASLKTSVKDIAIPLFANDAEVKIEAYCSSAASSPCVPANQHKVYLYNRGTSNITSATINYNVNGGANTPVNWTGTLLPNAYTLVSFSTAQASGTLNVSVATVNGGADMRSTNNTNSRAFSFTAPPIPPDHAYTVFNFTLVGDRYGSETTWALRDAAGTILYQGGPYGNLAANGTQTLVNNAAWNLLANGCYTLQVSDSYGDGINSGYGAGNFNVKTNSGTITVFSNTTFTTGSATHYFKNTALSSDSFDLLDSVILYPNPAKDKVTISIPQGLEATGKFDVFNALGQKISTKKVSSENDLTINTNDYQTGMYFINLTIGEFSKTLRFVKE
ncbi:MAG: M43 family zinc metalloprotease [Bacteroidota bacterium]